MRMPSTRTGRIRWAACGGFLVALTVVPLAFAAVTFNSFTPPTWNGSNWVATANVTFTGGSDKTVCLEYDTPSDPLVSVYCGSINPPGTFDFTCTIPGPDVANEPSPIAWQLAAWTGNSGCTGSRTAGPGGTFAPNGTGPLAVGLGGFSAVSGQGWSLLLGLVGLAAVAILMIRRRGQGAVAPAGR
ncbi:MAG: hypothetical protein IPJ58_10680 [Ardenticatenia bacterium]|nr:hypothetical protein [Ardenticatenia bacterium]